MYFLGNLLQHYGLKYMLNALYGASFHIPKGFRFSCQSGLIRKATKLSPAADSKTRMSTCCLHSDIWEASKLACPLPVCWLCLQNTPASNRFSLPSLLSTTKSLLSPLTGCPCFHHCLLLNSLSVIGPGLKSKSVSLTLMLMSLQWPAK